MTQKPHLFENEITKTVRLGYWLHLPPGYDGAKKWPLIYFLHGRGERGDGVGDLALVKKHGLAKLVDEQPDFPFIVISPQCPTRGWWPSEIDALKALLDFALDEYAVDKSRVYLTGLSMGGFGSWTLGSTYPSYFAAIAPICGGDDPDNAALLKDVPVWAFHGDADDIVPLSASQEMVEALKAAGGDVRFTVYPGVGHNSWTQTYENPELYDWFLSHQKA